MRERSFALTIPEMERPESLFRVTVQPLAVAVLLAFALRPAVRIYSIPSPSMAPTLQTGDHILAVPYAWGSPRRGDVIVFRSPANPDELAIKRVVGLPGDLIESHHGRIRVGGYTLAEPYALNAAASGMIDAQIVPSECYFVVGDNRQNSYDSRHWGPLPASLVVARARLILWSSADDDGHLAAHASPLSGARPSLARVPLHRIFKTID